MADGEKVDTAVSEVDSCLEKYVVNENIVEGSELVVEGSESVPHNMADGENVDAMVSKVDSCLEKHVDNENIVDGSESVPNVEERECGMFEKAGLSIEEDMEKVSLVGESIEDTVNVKSEMIKNENGEEKEPMSDEDESKNSDSEEAATSSSSSSDDDDGEGDNDVEQEEKGETEVAAAEGKVREAGEVEEGEISNVGGEDMPDENDDEDAMVGWSDVDEEAGEEGQANPIMSRNEAKVLPSVPSVDAELLPDHEMMPVGAVLSILGSQVIVHGIEKHNPLSDGSILWITESRSPLGFVDEIFGPVKHPYYVVRYNSEDEVPGGIGEGTSVSFVPEFASHVLSNPDIYKKGYDASGANDEELSEEEEFSDDEKESEHKRMLKSAKRGTNEQQQPRSGKNLKNNADRRDEPWKNGNPQSQQMPNDAGHMLPDQNQPFISPPPPAAGPGNYSNPYMVGGTGLDPSNPPLAYGAYSPANAVWANGMPYQPPQGAFFPNTFPMNNMPPQQYLLPYQMPGPGGVPYQLVNMKPVILPGQQNVFAEYTYVPAYMGQNSFSTNAYGMGIQGPPSSQPGLNGGEQGNTSQGAHMGESIYRPQHPGTNYYAPRHFNQGASEYGGGSGQHGGDRFPRGRRRDWK